MANFDTAKMPDLTGKVVVVTGGTAGLGRETVVSLAKAGASHIFFTGRNDEAADITIQAAQSGSIKVTFVKIDLSDLLNVKSGAQNIADSTSRIDLLFCNAGVMALPAGLSKDGFEIQFATNHLGHAMLVRQLLPLLQRTAAEPDSDVRVIFTSSLGHMFASKIQYDTLRTKQESMIIGGFKRYGQSKLANILYPSELARRFPSIKFVSVHPGVIRTNLLTNASLSFFNRWFTEAITFGQQVSVEEGVKNQLWAATTAKGNVTNGAFYEPVGKPATMPAAMKDEDTAKELYVWTEEVLREF